MATQRVNSLRCNHDAEELSIRAWTLVSKRERVRVTVTNVMVRLVRNVAHSLGSSFNFLVWTRFFLLSLLRRRRHVMRTVWLTVFAGCLAAELSGAPIGIGVQVTNLGSNSYRDTYSISGFASPDVELDIYFDPALYGTLSNGVAQPSSDWNLLLFQPNNPPGAFGDYSLAANVANPSLAGPFSVDFAFLGSGQPGSQPFQIFELAQNSQLAGVPCDSAGDFTCATTPQGASGIPEPASFSLVAAGVLIGSVLRTARRRTGKMA